MSQELGYSEDICHFCGKKDAGYQRAEDKAPNGPFFDACEKCAKKHYPARENSGQEVK